MKKRLFNLLRILLCTSLLVRVTDLVKNRGSTSKQEIRTTPILPAALYFHFQIVRHLDASRPWEGAELCRPAGYVTPAPVLTFTHPSTGLTPPGGSLTHTGALSPTPAAPRTPPRTPPAAADFATRLCEIKSPSPITLPPSTRALPLPRWRCRLTPLRSAALRLASPGCAGDPVAATATCCRRALPGRARLVFPPWQKMRVHGAVRKHPRSLPPPIRPAKRYRGWGGGTRERGLRCTGSCENEGENVVFRDRGGEGGAGAFPPLSVWAPGVRREGRPRGEGAPCSPPARSAVQAAEG